MRENKGTFTSKILAYLIRAVFGILLSTCRLKVRGKENLIEAVKKGPCIIMLWHNRLVAIGSIAIRTFKKVRFCAFVSNSKDGEILAQYCMTFGRGDAIRVPHDSKDQALKAMITRLKYTKDILIITPDGPKGPRYEIKPGIAVAAKDSKAAIIPFDWVAKSYWELKTWDRLRIPKPFTTIEATFGTPIRLDKDSPLEEDTALLQNALSIE